MEKLSSGLIIIAIVSFFLIPSKSSTAGIRVNTRTAADTGGKKLRVPNTGANCPAVYALVLGGSYGSPVPEGLESSIYKIDLCADPVIFKPVSSIKIGKVPVKDVTGICDMPGVANYAWAVTGQNSNFPQKLLKVQITTGEAAIVAATSFPLQDIENYGTDLFVAIKENSAQLIKVVMPSGECTVFAPSGPPGTQYNGLTVVGNKFQVISGLTNTVMPARYGDIFEYPITGGNYTAKCSYQNLAINSFLTMKELGFYFDKCCGKKWVIGSSIGAISNNLTTNVNQISNPNYLLGAKPIYDFMVKN